MTPVIIIINLETDESRRKYMENELKKHNISNYFFIKAVDGYNLNYNNMDKNILSTIAINQILNKEQRYGLTLSPGGAGLYNTWYNIINKYQDYEDIIIFEDDITLTENFMVELQKTYATAPTNYDILYLGSHQHLNIKNPHINPYEFIKLNNIQINGTFSMILSKIGREKIKKICFPANDLQIDTILYQNFNSLNCYHINNSIVFSNNNFESNIQKNMDVFNTFKDLEIHILICNKDFTMGMESIHSLLIYNEFKYVDIYYHNDGSLTPVQIQILKDKNFNIIDKDDHRIAIQNKIQKNKVSYNYRFGNKPYSFWHKLKLFDYFLSSKTKRILGLDTDILFMKKPNDIIRLITEHKSFYMTDNKSSYCFNGIVNTHLDGVLESVNTGIIYIDNEKDYDINLIEEGLQKIIINDANYFPSWIEQSAFAYMFSKLKTYTALSGDKYKFPFFQNIDINEVEALHFVSYPPCRNMWNQYVNILKFNDDKPKLQLEHIDTNVIFNPLNPAHPHNSNLIAYNTPILLSIYIYDLNETHFIFKFNWNLPKDKNLSHTFRINDVEYSYGSEYEGVIYLEKTKKPISIYHTYEWYGSINWKLIKIIEIN
jgi:GR25 family glycosyltransferase involved in LPS biosynthesis